ncbi:uncharacterized protein LOC119794107 [Cyprinodon tularosa]|uniref:uncharacterized protein LOC119794107 n=1 Tax=Cyprinodon tularosa TaxID=77115 RepID=UPI0018E1E91E|nr:uncharacterized protein LOC119794107 [Cyprinodon tularosa]
MDDDSQSLTRRVIYEGLADLPVSTLQTLEDTLESLGVETNEDFQYINENDLRSVLTPIQARKLLKASKQTTQTSGISSEPSLSLSSPSTTSTSSASSFSIHSTPVDWVDTFQIPWNRFPENLIECFKNEARPKPHLRREMIRIVVSSMMEVCASPRKQETTEVAKKLIAKYPLSLQDIIEGDIVGPGYYSLVKQLQNRIENLRRVSKPKIRKRKNMLDEDGTVPPEQNAAVQDIYGCIKWDMEVMPIQETAETQKEKKVKLKMLSEENNLNSDEIRDLMQRTYYTQRKEINQGKDLQIMVKEWPFLFQEIGMTIHFQELTGVNLLETFHKNLEKKGKRLLDYLRTVSAHKIKRVLQTVRNLDILRGQVQGCSEELKDLVLLLLSHFNDKEETLFHYVDETCLAGEVKVDNLPVTPCLIVCGTSCYTSKNFMLGIDGNVVNDQIPTFTSAICLMLASYFCFNIHYPTHLASTLDFIQRCFLNINPDRGTKVETKKNKKNVSVNPRVLTLISEIADHEWRGTY